MVNEKNHEKVEENKTQEVTKDESVEVINWSRDTMPKLSIMTTISPQDEEVKELNKDDTIRNNSEEEVEKVETSTLTPETEEEVTTTIPETTHEVSTEDDSSMFDEVRKSLKDLFGMSDDDENEEEIDTNTTIVPPTEESEVTTSTPEVSSEQTVASTSEPIPDTTTDSTPSDPMGSLVLATSTSRHISLETEICYRGRCIKTDKKLEKK